MADYAGSILKSGERSRLLAIQRTTRQLDESSLRLASGKKVNSALDNPENFFTARTLLNRSHDLRRLLDGIGQNIRTVEIADHGIKAQLGVLDMAESYLQEIEQKYLNGEIETKHGLPENETYLTFAGNADIIPYISGQDVPASGPITVTGDNEVTFSGNFWRRAALNYNITAETVLIFEYRSTLQPEISAIGFDNDTNFNNDNNRFYLYGTQASGINYAAPRPTFAYTDIGNWQRIEIPVGAYFTGTFSHINFVHDDDVAPFGNASFRNITLREGPEQPGKLISDGQKYEREYTDILDQLDTLAIDAHYRGINLLKGDNMTSIFNTTNTSVLLTQGMTSTRMGLGLIAENFDNIEAVRTKLSQIHTARMTLRSYSATLTNNLSIIQTREIFTEKQAGTSQSGAKDLTDVDMNEEGAEFLALQTRQQLQTTILAMRTASILNVLN